MSIISLEQIVHIQVVKYTHNYIQVHNSREYMTTVHVRVIASAPITCVCMYLTVIRNKPRTLMYTHTLKVRGLFPLHLTITASNVSSCGVCVCLQ